MNGKSDTQLPGILYNEVRTFLDYISSSGTDRESEGD